MKNILFVMPKFAPGGAEKSLLMLLYYLSKNAEYQVDLILFKNEGIFLKQLPDNINVVNCDTGLEAAYSSFGKNYRMTPRNMLISVMRFISTAFFTIFTDSYNKRNQFRWKYVYKLLIKNLPKQYDVACGYLDGESIYYIVDKVTAVKKYGWNQNDYSGIKQSPKIDGEYYEKVDGIITLSDACMSILQSTFPAYVDKMKLIPPLVSSDYIRAMAGKFIPKEFENVSGYKIVSVGRLVEQKGFDLAIKAAREMAAKHFVFTWYIIGNGELKNSLEKLIHDNNLNKYVKLLGEKENPYPYINNADLFVQPSRFEGKSVILNEVKMLAKPILVTDYPTVKDQIMNDVDGKIVDLSEYAIADAILFLSNNPKITEIYVENLKKSEFEDKKVLDSYLELFC